MITSLETARRLAGSRLRLLAACALLGLLATLCVACPGAVPEEGDACDALGDCAEGDQLVCNEGRCARLRCRESEDCPVDTVCIATFCGPVQCNAHDECTDEAICWKGKCIADGCTGREECSDGQVCLGDPPKCTAPPERCTEDHECPSGTACAVAEGTCLDICTGDDDCSGQTQCLLGLCRPPCSSDQDCPAGRTCHESRCEEFPDCSGQPECSGLRPYRDPQTCSCAMCLSTDDCDRSRSEVCADSGECLYCEQPATSEAQCTQVGMVFADGCCTECRSDEDCPSSQTPFCDRGRCVAAPPTECIAHSDCDEGMSCDLGRCVEPPSLSSCQTQQDCAAGEACYADGRCHAEAESCAGCPDPSRCVAERGDEAGTCAGCTQMCDEQACPADQVCFVAEGADEGYCIDQDAVSSCN